MKRRASAGGGRLPLGRLRAMDGDAYPANRWERIMSKVTRDADKKLQT